MSCAVAPTVPPYPEDLVMSIERLRSEWGTVGVVALGILLAILV
jgi:hypothetical protein